MEALDRFTARVRLLRDLEAARIAETRAATAAVRAQADWYKARTAELALDNAWAAYELGLSIRVAYPEGREPAALAAYRGAEPPTDDPVVLHQSVDRTFAEWVNRYNDWAAAVARVDELATALGKPTPAHEPVEAPPVGS